MLKEQSSFFNSQGIWDFSIVNLVRLVLNI